MYDLEAVGFSFESSIKKNMLTLDDIVNHDDNDDIAV